MIGGELAIKEPARMLISILDKFLDKKEVYNFVKKYYSQNQFELLYNQLQQNFNCVETSSTGRILDAVSLFLGFCKNERNYKHEPIDLLEKNSTKPYSDLKPALSPPLEKGDQGGSNAGSGVPPEPYISENTKPYQKQKVQARTLEPAFNYILNTTFLFKYLIKNLHKDKKRLAATAQLYIAEGLHEIICHSRETCSQLRLGNGNLVCKTKDAKLDSRLRGNDIFLSGGISNNKIIANYFESRNVYTNKKIPRGDAGISFGQIVYFLLNKSSE